MADTMISEQQANAATEQERCLMIPVAHRSSCVIQSNMTGKSRACLFCKKEVSSYENFCSWDCQIENAKASGGKVHTPNGLPIKCIRADGTMLECEHGDHPDYRFPVSVEYIGPINEDLDEFDQRYLRNPQRHALIYSDDSVALTLHECLYNLFFLGGRHPGLCKTDKNYKLSQESLDKIAASKQPKAT